MTQFWFGFITAMAVIAVGVIIWAVIAYRRKEQEAKVVLSPMAYDFLSKIMAHPEPSDPTNSQRKKGMH